MIFSSSVNNMKKTWSDSTSFPWLVATMIIIAICMIEELSMKEKYKNEYDDYRNKTPFLLPTPNWLRKILKAPMKLITSSRYPRNRKQVAGIVLIYTIILMSVSLLWVDIGVTDSNTSPYISNYQVAIDSIDSEIQQTVERRELHKHFTALGQFGNVSAPQLIQYLSNPDPVIREFAANQLGNIRSKNAVEPLILALKDENWRVKNSAANALSDIGDQRAAGPVMEIVKNTPVEERSRFYSLLGSFKVVEAWPILVEGTNQPEWYKKVAALRAMSKISLKKAKPYMYTALSDTQFRVKREVVFMLLELKPKDAVKPLQSVLDDEDFETRFYAKEAIKLIEEEYN